MNSARALLELIHLEELTETQYKGFSKTVGSPSVFGGQVLAQAIKELYQSDAVVKVIGTRHGEKLYESLLTREEVIKAEDLGDYYRIPADNRDLNYANYYSKGEIDISEIEDYHSHNTERLDVEGMKALLLKLDFIREDIKA